jgi:hypothetical protein
VRLRSRRRPVIAAYPFRLDNQPVWPPLRAAIIAASEKNLEGFRCEMRRMARRVHKDRWSGVYVWYLLRMRSRELVGRKPDEESLTFLASEIYPRFVVVAPRVEHATLIDLLLGVWEIQPAERDIVGSALPVIGAAALGAMLDDASRQLDAMKPALEDWYDSNRYSFDRETFDPSDY